MFGARKRIGYISPSVLEVVPFEFYRFAPEGVGPCRRHLQHRRLDRASISSAPSAQVKEAAAYLGARGVDYIVHGGGPLVVARGKGYEDLIVKDIEAAAKVPATTGVRSGMEALRTCRRAPDRHRLALSRAAQFRAVGYLTAHRLRDRPRRRQGTRRSRRCRTCRRAKSMRSPAACSTAPGKVDALYLPCPQWQAAQVVDALERERALPVVAYTHAQFFVAFRALGIKDAIRGHGRLLASLAE